MAKLSQTDKNVFEFIKNNIENGITPTIRDICAEFDMKSTSSAHRCVSKLIEAGYLEKEDGKSRAVRLPGSNGMRVPLVGTVTAGAPITAIEYITDYIAFHPERNYQNPLFALKVRGESMINVGIFDGDIVVAEQTPVASNGDTVVALVDDEDATVKTFYKENGHFRLQPENDYMDPIICQNVAILGKVVAVIRYL